MLDGFQYVLAQIGVVVVVTALLAGVLGWLVGRGSRRRTEKAFERAIAAVSGPEAVASRFAPTSSSADTAEDPETPLVQAEETEAPAEVTGPPLAQRQPYGIPVIEHVPLDDMADPDATVIRQAPSSKTPPYLPPTPVISSTPLVPNAPLYRARLGVQAVTAEEVQQLRHELRNRDLELGLIEAGALSAWDRTVPKLGQQIDELMAENDAIRRRVREVEEHSDADALTVDHLRALVAERDARIAELRPGA